MTDAGAHGDAVPFTTRGFELHDWQRQAVEAWVDGDASGPFRGTFEIFTGGGKTLIALACAERAARHTGLVRLAIVVPTEALAHQWIQAVLDRTSVGRGDVGLLGAGGRDDLRDKRVLVAVLNTASRRLPEMAQTVGDHLMLVVDECHRAGAPTFSSVLGTRATFRLGLSATPDREELDDEGEPLAYDEQLVGKSLGEVVFRFGLREARQAGWLPEFTVQHHGVQLLPDERVEYDRVSREIDELGDRLQELGGEPSRARSFAAREGDIGRAASAYVAATSKRKDLLYRASERGRVAVRLLHDVLGRRPGARVLIFHERIGEAQQLHDQLRGLAAVGIEHSRLADSVRRSTLDQFRTGSLDVLVSVKSLIEGLDVPSADVGVSVASSSSVRQRIQSLGRVLRRTFDNTEKVAEMHVLYVADSVDEIIYAKEDWADLTGDAANTYWLWGSDPDEQPTRLDGPPRIPAPTEEQEWERLGGAAPSSPQPWLGAQPSREYSVDTSGTVRNAAGSLIANPQGVDAMVEAVRGRPGGRFFVTPVHRLVVVREAVPDGRLLVTGQLAEPFTTRADHVEHVDVDVSNLVPGESYRGALDAGHGEYRILQKRGGVIQRDRGAGVKEFALTEGHDTRSGNAARTLAAWRAVASTGLKIAVNSAWHAWYLDRGEPRFLAHVPGGYAWPSDTEGDVD